MRLNMDYDTLWMLEMINNCNIPIEQKKQLTENKELKSVSLQFDERRRANILRVAYLDGNSTTVYMPA